MTTGKSQVLFVDDDPYILCALRRSMHEMDDTWDMRFCSSAAEALAAMETCPANVIISDMRMPQMDGAELLGLVRTRFPQTIRVILSGYAEMESVLKTVGPAHIYVAKPCNEELLMGVISRAATLQRYLTDPALLATIGGLANLPSPPAIYLRLTDELRRPEASSTTVADILAGDIAMTAEILKLTNSAFFALNTRISTVHQAVKILGLDTIRSLVLQAGIFRELAGPDTSPNTLNALIGYSLELADLAQAIAVTEGADSASANAAYCAAMLSSIGSLVFLDLNNDLYVKTLNKVGPVLSQHEAETQAFGTNHHRVGAYLLGLWGFPDSMVEAVAFAADPSTVSNPDNPLLLATHVARALHNNFPLLQHGTNEPPKLDMAYLIDIRKDGRVREWKQLATERRGLCNG